MLPQAEHQPERVALRARQRIQPVKIRAEDLVQGGEAELGLRLHPVEPDDVEPAGRGLNVVKEGGLPGPRFAPQDQHSAQPLTCAFEDLL
jgi:hypothetical protein